MIEVHPPGGPIPAHARGCALALGNFDGVHAGHRAVIAAARAAATHGRVPLAVATFEPHPRRFFAPDAEPFLLQSRGQRARALAAQGAVHLFELAFDARLAALSDAAFVDEVLVGVLGAAHVAIGFDFTFGVRRMGDARRMVTLGALAGFGVSVVGAHDEGGDKVSSTRIRACLSAGDPVGAAALMGAPFAIEGQVIHGFARGRTIGVPTANVGLGDYVRPRFGVYATRTDIGDGVWRPGVANVGVKPTVAGDHAPLLEVHLFDFEGDLYGRTVETRLLHFLREERRFDSFAALTDQIARDAAAARAGLD